FINGREMEDENENCEENTQIKIFEYVLANHVFETKYYRKIANYIIDEKMSEEFIIMVELGLFKFLDSNDIFSKLVNKRYFRILNYLSKEYLLKNFDFNQFNIELISKQRSDQLLKLILRESP